MCRTRRFSEEITYSEAAELAYAGAKVLHPRTLAPLVERGIPVWSKNSFAPEKPGTRIVPALGAGNPGARAVTSMAKVALVSLEPASSGVGGVHIMARSLDALDRANVEVLAVSGSSYRQSFCFLVRDEELENATEAIEAALALELAHGYVRGIEVDREVGLLAVVGRRDAGIFGRCGAHFHGDFPRKREYHRDRAGIERTDDFDRGAAGRAGEGGAGGSRRMPPVEPSDSNFSGVKRIQAGSSSAVG